MSSVDHVEMTCCVKDCHAIITLHRGTYEQRRRDHARFYCPAGHGQSFTGKSESEKEIERLNASLRRLGRHLDQLLALREELVGAAKECPLGCGFRSRRFTVGSSEWAYARMVERARSDVHDHLVAEHGAEVLEAEDAAV